MSLFTDDDDDFLNLSSTSSTKNKLGSLFGAPQEPKGNESLQYNRPKQPKNEPKAKAASEPALPTTLLAIAVNLFKLENNNWKSSGQVACAIAENKAHTTKYQLILYYSKTQILATIPINAAFKYTPQTSNNEFYANFYDTKNQNWSIRFNTVEDADNFAVNFALAKYYDNPTSNELIIQDIYVPTKGVTVGEGDTLGIRYTTWNLVNGVLNKLEDNSEQAQPKKVILGAKKAAPGWEASLSGMRKLQRRAVIVPAGYGGETEVKVYKFVLEKMKRADPSAAQEKPPATPQQPTIDTESLDIPSDSSTKASIMKRIQKMGVSTLPRGELDSEDTANVTPQEAAEPSPVSTAVPTAEPTPSSPQQPQTAVPLSQHASPSPQHTPYQQPGVYISQPQVPVTQPNFGPTPTPMAAGLYPVTYGTHPALAPSNQLALVTPNTYSQQYLLQQQLAPVQPTPEPVAPKAPEKPAEESKTLSPDTIKLMVEEHQFKSNIQTKLDGISQRVDEVLTRMDGTIFTKNKDIGPGVSAKALLQTIQRIVTENEKFALELDARNQKIEALTEKLNKLHETNQRVIEDNNRFMEQRSANLKAATEQTMQQLELYREEKAQLEQELSTAQRKYQALNRAYTNLKDEVDQFKEQAEKSKAAADALNTRVAELEQKLLESDAKLREGQLNLKKLQTELATLQTELAEERELNSRMRKIIEDNKARMLEELNNREASFEEERKAFSAQIAALREALTRERAKFGSTQELIDQALESQRKELEAHHAQTLEVQKSSLESEWRRRMEEQRKKEQEAVNSLQNQIQQLKAQLNDRDAIVEAAKAQLAELQRQNRELAARAASATAPAETGSTGMSHERLVDTVKLIMNNVYRTLNSKFDDETTYEKANIMTTIRGVIVETTLQLVNAPAPQAATPAPTPATAPASSSAPTRATAEEKKEEPQAKAEEQSAEPTPSPAPQEAASPAPAAKEEVKEEEKVVETKTAEINLVPTTTEEEVVVVNKSAEKASSQETTPNTSPLVSRPAVKPPLFFDEDDEEEEKIEEVKQEKQDEAKQVEETTADEPVNTESSLSTTSTENEKEVKQEESVEATQAEEPAFKSSPVPTRPAVKPPLFFDEEEEEEEKPEEKKEEIKPETKEEEVKPVESVEEAKPEEPVQDASASPSRPAVKPPLFFDEEDEEEEKQDEKPEEKKEIIPEKKDEEEIKQDESQPETTSTPNEEANVVESTDSAADTDKDEVKEPENVQSEETPATPAPSEETPAASAPSEETSAASAPSPSRPAVKPPLFFDDKDEEEEKPEEKPEEKKEEIKPEKKEEEVKQEKDTEEAKSVETAPNTSPSPSRPVIKPSFFYDDDDDDFVLEKKPEVKSPEPKSEETTTVSSPVTSRTPVKPPLFFDDDDENPDVDSIFS